NRKTFSVLPESEGLVVQSAASDGHGGLWIAYHGNEVDHWNNHASERFSLTDDRFTSAPAVFVDHKGQVFTGISRPSPDVPKFLEYQTNQFSPLPGIDLHQDVSAIHQDRAGRLWIGTQSGIQLLDGQNSKLYSVADGLPSQDVRAIADDTEGNIWI